jgi:hypothetical protein
MASSPGPAEWVWRVNARVAKEELGRLRSCIRRSRPFARRRLRAADGAAAGLVISAARSVAAQKAHLRQRRRIRGIKEECPSVPLPSLGSPSSASPFASPASSFFSKSDNEARYRDKALRYRFQPTNVWGNTRIPISQEVSGLGPRITPSAKRHRRVIKFFTCIFLPMRDSMAH